MVRAEVHDGAEAPIPRDNAVVVASIGITIEHFEATISGGRRRRVACIEAFVDVVRARVELGVRIVFSNVRGNPHAVNMPGDLADEGRIGRERSVVVHDQALERIKRAERIGNIDTRLDGPAAQIQFLELRAVREDLIDGGGR